MPSRRGGRGRRLSERPARTRSAAPRPVASSRPTRACASHTGSRRSSRCAWRSSAPSRSSPSSSSSSGSGRSRCSPGDEYLNAAQSNQLRLIRVEAPRGPILDRRGRVVVSNVAGTAVELWVGGHAEARADTTSCSGSPRSWTSPRARSRARSRSVASIPLTPIVVKTSVGEEQVNYLYEHQAEFPGVEDRPGLPPRLHVRDARGADPRVHGRDLAGGAEAAAQGRSLPRRRPDREDRHRGRLRLVPARPARAGADPRRLARAAAVAGRAPPGVDARATRCD